MTHFDLPHRHGHDRHAEQFHADLARTAPFEAAAELFRLLSDPTRLKIYWLLSHREECVINIAALLEMSSPAVFHHLRSLQEGGLIHSRREGKEVFYAAVDTEDAHFLHDTLEQVMAIACPENKPAGTASPEDIARQVHGYVMEHLQERLTIEALARKFLINTTTLKEAFRKVYGASLAAHMKAHRMERAARLLRETEDSVAAVAQSVGYGSQSRFTAAFREIFGLLPTAYRRQHRP